MSKSITYLLAVIARLPAMISLSKRRAFSAN